jgi:beta-hydroxylase
VFGDLGAADEPATFSLSLRAPGRAAPPPDAARIELVTATCRSLGRANVQWNDAPAALDDLLRLADALAVGDAATTVAWSAATTPSLALADPARAARLFRGGCRSLTLDVGAAAEVEPKRTDPDATAAPLASVCAALGAAGIAPAVVFRIGNEGEDRAAVLASLERIEVACAGRGLAVFDGIAGGLAGRYAATEGDDWLPHPRPGVLVKEELRPLETMLAAFAVRTWSTAGRLLALAAVGGPPAVAALQPFAVPSRVRAFCTPYAAEAAAPRSHFAPTGDQVLFDDDFGFRRDLEAAFAEIRAEWLAFPRSARLEYRDAGASNGYWAQLGLCGAGMRVPSLRRSAPRLAAILARVPGLYTAAFSIVGPRTRITPHCGEDRTLLRCHLPIDIPEPSGILVGDVRLPWIEGRTIVFDDTLPHGAWNDADREKVLLMIDFRPPSRAAQGFAASAEQIARDRAQYLRLYPEWGSEVEIDPEP